MAADTLVLGAGTGGGGAELFEESEASRDLEGSVGADILSLELDAIGYTASELRRKDTAYCLQTN